MVRTIMRSYVGVFTVLAAMALLCVLVGSSAAATGATTLVSVNDSGVQQNLFSGQSDISGNGRYVAFTSTSSNLVDDDTNTFSDVFVHDRDADADGVFDEVNEPGAISTERVSVSSAGTAANAASSDVSISANGRYVAFLSAATNLVADDTNLVPDAFVRDRQTGETQRVSVDSLRNQANGESSGTSSGATDISSNGRVAFVSRATNLVPGDTNNQLDFFVHDLNTGTTERVNVDNDGKQVNGGVAIDISISSNGRYVGFTTNAPLLVPDDPGDEWDGFVRDLDPVENQTRKIWRVAYSASGAPSISDAGRVAFTSYAPNLVPNDTNGVDDVFVRDLPAGPIQRVSVDSSGNQANGRSFFGASISSDGHFVAFDSSASNLVPNDTNTFRDVFVRDLSAQTTERVSVDSSGNQANGNSFFPSISSDGRFVAFNSGASNLVPGDTNSGGDVFVHERLTDTTPPNDGIAPSTTASATTNTGGNYTSGTWTKEDVKVTLSAQDNDGGSGVNKITYSASGAQTIAQTDASGSSVDVTLNQEGTTTLSYFATDNAGNQESPAKTFMAKIDRSAPTTSATARDSAGNNYTSGTWTNKNVTIELSANDGSGSGVREISYSINGGANQTYNPTNKISVTSEGTTTISYFATDIAGNQESQTHTFEVKLDKTAPAVSSTNPANNATGVAATTNISAKFSESGSGIVDSTLNPNTFKVVQVKPTGNVPVSATAVTYDAGTQTATFDPSSSLAKGLYRATLTGVKDKAGNVMPDYTWTFATAGPPSRR